MPSHKIHLAIAKKINDKLNLDLDLFMLGNVLPDICRENHRLSHYQNPDKKVLCFADPDKFLSKHKNELNNPIMLGYLTHILADRFYNEYIFKNFYVYDDNNNCIGIKYKGEFKELDADERKELKHKELETYDIWLLNNNYVSKFKDLDCYKKVKDFDDITFSEDRLIKYIEDANKDIDDSHDEIYDYKLSTQEELNNIFNNCIKYILDYLSKNWRIIK